MIMIVSTESGESDHSIPSELRNPGLWNTYGNCDHSERLKTGAEWSQEQQYRQRAEFFALPALRAYNRRFAASPVRRHKTDLSRL